MGDPNYVLIDLEFDTQSEAEALLAAMREVWRRVQGQVMSNPQVRIIETVETKEYYTPAGLLDSPRKGRAGRSRPGYATVAARTLFPTCDNRFVRRLGNTLMFCRAGAKLFQQRMLAAYRNRPESPWFGSDWIGI